MQRTEVKNIVKRLNHLCKCLHDMYDINYGGCCYVAYIIAKHLDLLGIKYNLVVCDDLKRNEKEINLEVHNKVKNCNYKTSVVNCTCNHYCINIIGVGHINRGKCKYPHKYFIKNIDNAHIKWIYNNGSWNERYDKKRNKIVSNMINNFFKEYEENNL